MVNDPLSLLFVEQLAPPRPVVLVQLPGAGAGRIAAGLAGRLDHGRRRLLPSPSPDSPASAMRDWHRDAWLALSGEERRSLALATGPTAGHLAAVIGDACDAVALVAEPLAGLRAAHPERLPRERALSSLGDGDEHHERRLRPWSNPQSRVLLGPWYDTAELTVTLGPPPDAGRWRELLFEDVLTRVEATADPAALARRIAGNLGLRPKRAARAALALAEADAPGEPVDARQAELLLELSWLDAELSARCSAASAAVAD